VIPVSRHIQAYFETENEAEHIRTLLQTYDTESVEVSRLDDGYLGGRNIIVPIAAVGTDSANTGSGLGVNGAGAGIAPFTAVGALDEDELDADAHHNLHYVLTAKVLEEEYEEVRNLIRHNRGHVERVD
jgi:hypothetical protein